MQSQFEICTVRLELPSRIGRLAAFILRFSEAFPQQCIQFPPTHVSLWVLIWSVDSFRLTLLLDVVRTSSSHKKVLPTTSKKSLRRVCVLRADGRSSSTKMPPGMCIYRMKPEICSLLLEENTSLYMLSVQGIKYLAVVCDRIPVLSGPPVWGTMRPKIEVWKRSNLWYSRSHGGSSNIEAVGLPCLVPSPSLGSRCTQTQ